MTEGPHIPDDDAPIVELVEGMEPLFTERYHEHRIQVFKTDRARPFVVAVDGALLFGNGWRVRRLLNYSTTEAAAAQGRRHVRQLRSGGT